MGKLRYFLPTLVLSASFSFAMDEDTPARFINESKAKTEADLKVQQPLPGIIIASSQVSNVPGVITLNLSQPDPSLYMGGSVGNAEE